MNSNENSSKTVVRKVQSSKDVAQLKQKASAKKTPDAKDTPPNKYVATKPSQLQATPARIGPSTKKIKPSGLNDYNTNTPIASSKTGRVQDALEKRQADKKNPSKMVIEKLDKSVPSNPRPLSRAGVLADKASKVYGPDKIKSKVTSKATSVKPPSSRINNVKDMNKGPKWTLNKMPWELDQDQIPGSSIDSKLNDNFSLLPQYDGFLLVEGDIAKIRPQKPTFPDEESDYNKTPLYLAKNRGSFFLTRTTAKTGRYVQLKSMANGDNQNDDLPEYKLRVYRGYHEHNSNNDGEKYVYYCDPVSGYSRYMRLADVSARVWPVYEQLKALYYWDWRRERTQAYIPVWHEDGKRDLKEPNLTGWNHASTNRKSVTAEKQDPSIFDQFIFYCNLLRQISVSVPETWSVFARYWDKHVDGITLFVVLNDVKFPELFPKKPTSKSVNVKKLVSEVQTSKNLSFKPALVEVKFQSVFASDVGDVELVGEHVIGLYSTYVSKTHLKILAKEGLLYRPRATPAKELLGDVAIHPQKADKTRTHVTVNKITQASAIKVRKPSQIQVMDYVSASDVAETFWPDEDIWRAAEWLHRSAYSFGGLGGINVHPNSSQTKENLVFGTYEANTWMLRFESSIKHLTDLEKNTLPKDIKTNIAPDPTSMVETKLIYDTKWHRGEAYRPSWFAHGLQYSWRFCARSRTALPSLADISIQHDIHLFDRQTPMRFEAYLDEALENALYKL